MNKLEQEFLNSKIETRAGDWRQSLAMQKFEYKKQQDKIKEQQKKARTIFKTSNTNNNNNYTNYNYYIESMFLDLFCTVFSNRIFLYRIFKSGYEIKK